MGGGQEDRFDVVFGVGLRPQAGSGIAAKVKVPKVGTGGFELILGSYWYLLGYLG
jgi:hypothetical protein